MGTTPESVPAASAQQFGEDTALHAAPGFRDKTIPAANESAEETVHPVTPFTAVNVAKKLAADDASTAPLDVRLVPGCRRPPHPTR